MRRNPPALKIIWMLHLSHLIFQIKRKRSNSNCTFFLLKHIILWTPRKEKFTGMCTPKMVNYETLAEDHTEVISFLWFVISCWGNHVSKAVGGFPGKKMNYPHICYFKSFHLMLLLKWFLFSYTSHVHSGLPWKILEGQTLWIHVFLQLTWADCYGFSVTYGSCIYL